MMTVNSPRRNGSLDPRMYYNSPTHEEALARLEWLVEAGQRLGLLLGACGSGKSLLLSRLADTLTMPVGATANEVVRCSLLGLDETQFLLEMAEQLELNPRTSWTLPTLWRSIVDRLKEHAYRQIGSVVLLDDAHTASSPVLMAIGRLAELNLAADARLTIVLACNDRQAKCLGERLLSRCALRIDAEPWSAEETLVFVQHAIAKAQAIDAADGDPPSAAFTPAAIEKIHELSGGIPRRANQLAQWALVAGAGLALAEIDEETVVAAAEEMGV